MEENTIQDLSVLSLNESHTRPQRPSHLASDPLSHLSTLQRGIIQAILNGTPTTGGIPVVVIAQAVGHHVRDPMEIRFAYVVLYTRWTDDPVFLVMPWIFSLMKDT